MAGQQKVRKFDVSEIRERNKGKGDDYVLAVIDNYVVEVKDFDHPGGLKKLLETNDAGAGATGREFGFSFSRGKNQHFPRTGATFEAACDDFLAGTVAEDGFLRPCTVDFGQGGGSIQILGVLKKR